MAWVNEPELAGDISEALSHASEADRLVGNAAWTSVCELYFKALNRFWNALAAHQGEPGRADTPSFVVLLQSLSTQDQRALLTGEELSSLVGLTPEVMDHSVLKARGYRPGHQIAAALFKEATERHRSLRRALAETTGREGSENLNRVLKRLAEFLFVIRSNIAHGEKIPYTPDFEKAKRDEEVSRLAVPVLQLIVRALHTRADAGAR